MIERDNRGNYAGLVRNLNTSEIYDLRTAKISDDIPFIQELSSNCGNSVIELACGTGRILAALKEQEKDLWGLDISGESLELARLKVPAAKLVQADMCEVSLETTFDLAILGFNAIEQILETEKQIALLKNVRKLLKAEGKLYIHTTLFDPETFVPQTGPKMLSNIYDLNGNEINVEFTAKRDLEARISHVTFRYTSPVYTKLDVKDEYRVKPLTAKELLDLLNTSGLEIHEKYEDFEKHPFNEQTSPVFIGVCGLKKTV